MTRPTTHHDRTDLQPTRRTVLSGGAAAAGLAAVAGAGTAPAHAQEPPPRAVPPGAQAEGSVPGSTVTRMGNVTGPGVTTEFDLERTDIGIPVTTPSGRTYVVFGDSFSGWDNTEAWRSPTALHADPDQDPSRLLEWSGPVGGERAVQLLPPYRDDGSGVTSKLPSDVLTVGETMYLQVWAVKGFPNLVRTELWKSTDKGATWTDTGITWDREFAGGNFWLWSWDLHDDGYAYIYSSQYRDRYTPEGQGGSDLFLWRVPHDRIEDKSAYESWGWTEESGWQWRQPISPILVSPRRENGLKYGFGEMALRKLGDRWMYTSVIGGTLQAYLLDNPWDDLYAIEPVTLLESGSPESATVVSSMYLGGIVPGATPEDFTLLVSQWVKDGDEEDGPHGWPYWVEQFRFQDFF